MTPDYRQVAVLLACWAIACEVGPQHRQALDISDSPPAQNAGDSAENAPVNAEEVLNREPAFQVVDTVEIGTAMVVLGETSIAEANHALGGMIHYTGGPDVPYLCYRLIQGDEERWLSLASGPIPSSSQRVTVARWSGRAFRGVDCVDTLATQTVVIDHLRLGMSVEAVRDLLGGPSVPSPTEVQRIEALYGASRGGYEIFFRRRDYSLLNDIVAVYEDGQLDAIEVYKSIEY